MEARVGATKVAEIRAFAAPRDSDNNVFLTRRTVPRPHCPRVRLKTDRNKNVMVVGGSGSGKTIFCQS